MKQYKHIPTGNIWSESKGGLTLINNEFIDYRIPREIVENSSDWEEVKPKEYVIMSVIGKKSDIWIKKDEDSSSFHCGDLFTLCDNFGENFKIHSVKRLSDSEIFSVGDICFPIGKYENNIHPITKIWICDNGDLRLSSENYSLDINGIQKAKNLVLFTTEDGVEIRKGDKFYVVDEKYGQFKMHDTIGGHFTKEHKNRKRFSSKSLAEEYVLMNKPCLSVNEVREALKYSISFLEPIVELAKSKINS